MNMHNNDKPYRSQRRELRNRAPEYQGINPLDPWPEATKSLRSNRKWVVLGTLAILAWFAVVYLTNAPECNTFKSTNLPSYCLD